MACTALRMLERTRPHVVLRQTNSFQLPSICNYIHIWLYMLQSVYGCKKKEYCTNVRKPNWLPITQIL